MPIAPPHMRLHFLVGLLALIAIVAAALLPATVSAQSPTRFRVTITNATNPEMIITPGAYAVHSTPNAFWTAGGTASLALERIAEIGDPAEAIASLGAVALDPAPANGDSITFEFTANPGAYLSTAQMLIATNDGFVGVDSLALWENGTPVTVTRDLPAWDAGTEANSDLFAGFDGGQPDPARGADNVDNGTATSEAIAAHPQFTGTQATLTIAPVTATALPSTGSGGLAGDNAGPNAWQWATLAGGTVLLLSVALRVARRA